MCWWRYVYMGITNLLGYLQSQNQEYLIILFDECANCDHIFCVSRKAKQRCQQSKAPHRDHFVRRPSVNPSRFAFAGISVILLISSLTHSPLYLVILLKAEVLSGIWTIWYHTGFLARRDECPESYCCTPCVSVRVHKNSNLAYNSWPTIGRAFIFHMCIPCDKTFPWVPKFLT